MAKQSMKKKKLNTDLDDTLISETEIDTPELGDAADVASDSENLIPYAIGKIEAEDIEDDEKEEFENAAKSVTNQGNDDEDAEWVEDEEYNNKDEDFFLDAEDYDPDDIESDDDIY